LLSCEALCEDGFARVEETALQVTFSWVSACLDSEESVVPEPFRRLMTPNRPFVLRPLPNCACVVAILRGDDRLMVASRDCNDADRFRLGGS